MNSKMFFQLNNNNTVSSKIEEGFEKDPKKVYIFSGNFKEGGFNILEDNFIDSDAKKYIVIGIDKKNTTKVMLDTLLKYTKDVYVYNNNELIEFDSSMCIFEYKDEAVIYNLSSNFSEGGLINNLSFYLETTYDLSDTDDKKEYKNVVKSITKIVEDEEGKFNKLTRDMVDVLQENKEIFTTKQYVHNVKSISELLGKEPTIKPEKKQMSKNEIEDIYVSNIEIPKIDIDEDDLELDDIDISGVDDEQILAEKTIQKKANKEKNDEKREEVNEIFEDGLKAEEDINGDNNVDSDFDENDTLDIADMLFSKADLALDLDEAKKESKKEIREKIKDDELVKVKKLNLNNISNFIYELPSKAKTAKNQDLLKIPNYISKMIPNFFELSDNSKTEEIDGAMYKVREVNIELVDVKNGKKYTDRNAKISYKVGQSYVSIISDVFKNVDYVEFDIARIIKLDSKVYHIEIITSDMQEYKLWSKLCNQDFKSSARKYGMM